VPQPVALLPRTYWKSFGLLPHGAARPCSVRIFGSKLVAFSGDWAVLADCTDS
jgi:hypothetical protein